MTYSMTAFARQESRSPMGDLICELRSVNHRYLDFNCRFADELRHLEPQFREVVAGRLKRGRVDCNMRFNTLADNRSEFTVDENILTQVLELGRALRQKVPELAALGQADVLAWPGVVSTPDLDKDTLALEATALFRRCVEELIQVRRQEGGRLREMIEKRLDSMREIIAGITQILPDLALAFRQRMEEKLSQVREQLDDNRLEQEMVLFQQKSDVSEEVDRLRLHIDVVEETLKKQEPVGRRLDFLMQELNREANTLSSKSGDVRLTNFAVELKVLIEQMREQVQNIE